MVDPNRVGTASGYAGAITGVAFLTTGYLDHSGVIDLEKGGFLESSLSWFILVPFVISIGWPGFKDFLIAIRAEEHERGTFVTRTWNRSWRFTRGLLLVVVPGAFVVYGLSAL